VSTQQLPSTPDRRRFLAACVYLLLIAGFVGLYIQSLAIRDPRHTDLVVYFDAGQRLRSGDALYFERSNPRMISQQYLYPPTLGIFFMIFPDLGSAWWGWGILSVLAFGLAIWIILRELRLFRLITRLIWRYVLLICILAFPPLFNHLVWGQLQLVLLGLLTGVWYCLRHRHDKAAGLLLGISIMLKLYPAIWLIPLIVQRRWLAAASAALVSAVVAVLSFSFVGWNQLGVFVTEIMPAVSRELTAMMYVDYYSLRATINFWHYLPTFAYAADLLYRIAVGVIFSAVCLRAKKRPDSLTPYAMTAMLIISPVIWTHYFVLLYLPLLDLLARSPRRHAIQVLALYLVFSMPPTIQIFHGLTMAFLHTFPTVAALALFVLQSRRLLAPPDDDRLAAPAGQTSSATA
jgi:alpha-1,2-mannosyltransferase